jgi:hypothetical protein
MHVLDAAAQTVDQYQGGAESLAPRIGISAGILRNKVNVNNSTNHLTLAEANRMMAVTGDHAILQALASEHGYALVKIENPDQATGVLHGMLDLGVAEGEFNRELHDAMADGRITPNEMSALGKASLAYQGALIGLLRRLHDEHARHGGTAVGG